MSTPDPLDIDTLASRLFDTAFLNWDNCHEMAEVVQGLVADELERLESDYAREFYTPALRTEAIPVAVIRARYAELRGVATEPLASMRAITKGAKP